MKEIESILKETLDQVIEFRNDYISNEQAVRTQLIEPILNVLGWKTHNPKFVRPNFPGEDRKIPDYTLLKDTKETLIVEAKNLSVDLQNKTIIDQLAGYCYNKGIIFGILTNGVKWLLFNTFERDPKERIIWQVDLENDNIGNISRKLASFSYENIDTLDNLLRTSKTLERNWEELNLSTESILKIISQKLLEKIKSKEPAFEIDYNDLRAFTKDKTEKMFGITQIQVKEETEEDNGADFTKAEFTGEKNIIFKNQQKNNQREKISVTFPDGTIINCKKPTDTFLETIKNIGPDKVLTLNITRDTVNIISDKKVNNTFKNIGKYWVNSHSSTSEKFRILERISKGLGLNLKIQKS